MKNISTIIMITLLMAWLVPLSVDAGNEHEWVDLGLPSGTLWATCNVGADTPEGFGDYFAWGETAPKDDYSWETYRWCNGYFNTMTKYCTNGSYGTVDNRTELDPEDDAAYVNWGSSWRMPTMEQQLELRNECTWTWTERNGVNGKLVTGPNGNTIFLPAAGYYDKMSNGNNVAGLNDYLYYWTSEQNHQGPMALDNSLISDRNSRYGVRNGQLSTTFKWRGCSVRPVRKK